MFDFVKNWLARNQIKAIEILNEQNAFDEKGKPILCRHEYEDWQQLTGAYIKKFLGKDSKFYTDFIEIKLLQTPIQTQPNEKKLALELWELQRANSTLQNCIIYISKFKYLYREPSLFGLLPVTGQISLAIFGATLFFYIGRFTVSEKQTFESEFRQCKEVNENLRHENDSLTTIISRPHILPNDSTGNKSDK